MQMSLAEFIRFSDLSIFYMPNLNSLIYEFQCLSFFITYFCGRTKSLRSDNSCLQQNRQVSVHISAPKSSIACSSNVQGLTNMAKAKTGHKNFYSLRMSVTVSSKLKVKANNHQNLLSHKFKTKISSLCETMFKYLFVIEQ